jgi:hypothetical protein
VVLLNAIIQNRDHDTLACQTLAPDLQDVQVWLHLIILCEAGGFRVSWTPAGFAYPPSTAAHHVPLLEEPGVRGHHQGAFHPPLQRLLLKPLHLQGCGLTVHRLSLGPPPCMRGELLGCGTLQGSLPWNP